MRHVYCLIISCLVIFILIPAAFQVRREFEPPISPLYSEEDLHWMALNIYHEARNQSLAGMLAVGQVVLNRLDHPKYPKTIKDIVTQAKLTPAGKPRLHACQFSWYCDGKPDDAKDLPALDRATYAARLVLERRFPDLIDGATHYHTHQIKVTWNYPLTSMIDSHIFYRRPQHNRGKE